MKAITFAELLRMIGTNRAPHTVEVKGHTFTRTAGDYTAASGLTLKEYIGHQSEITLDRLSFFPDFKIMVDGELTEKEKEYLEAVMDPFADRFLCLKKGRNAEGDYLVLQVCKLGEDDRDDPDVEEIEGPTFPRNARYAALEANTWYTAAELGLWL